MSIRTFLAIDLNDAIRQAYTLFQEQVSHVLPVKWVTPQALHLTVKFLGDIEAEQIPIIEQTVQNVVQDMAPFTLMIGGIGGFPTLQRPRIVWAGVSGDIDELEVLVSCLESALSAAGCIQEDRPYHPHLTLSRVKTYSREIGRLIESVDLFKKPWLFGELSVDRLCLFRSQLTPQGAIYSKLREWPFDEH